MVMVSLYLRDGDVTGALSAVENEPFRYPPRVRTFAAGRGACCGGEGRELQRVHFIASPVSRSHGR